MMLIYLLSAYATLALAQVLPGLPTQIIGRLREQRDSVFVDLRAELQASYDWAKTQPGWADLGFPLDQTVPGLPVVGDLAIHVQDMLIRRFDAFKEDGETPIVEKTEYGYRMGLFNIGLDFTGVVLKTGGFFGGVHEGTLTLDIEECWVEVECFADSPLPRIIAKVENAAYDFHSPSMLTEIMMKPALLLAESFITEAIEKGFAAALLYFWIPVNCEAYIAAAADALAVPKQEPDDDGNEADDEDEPADDGAFFVDDLDWLDKAIEPAEKFLVC